MMFWSVYRRHAPALVIIIVSVLIWVVLLPTLPGPVTARFAFSDGPPMTTPPSILFAAMCGFMAVSHIVIVMVDLFLFTPIIPGFIMASTDWVVQGVTAIVYLSLAAAGAGVVPGADVSMIAGLAVMIAVLGVLYRKAKESADGAAQPLTDSPYFERVAPLFITRLVFFIRPLFPSYIVVASGGIRLIGALYDQTFSWEDIEAVKKAGLLTFFSNRPIKLNQTLKNSVEIRLKKKRDYIVISPKDRERFLEAAGIYTKDS